MTTIFAKVMNNLVKVESNLKGFKYCYTMAKEVNVGSHEFVDIENPYTTPRRQCILCKYKIEPDYKNVRLLSQFQSRFTGRIYPRNVTGLCKAKYLSLVKEIAKAQNAGLMGVMVKNPEFAHDPALFDPNRPIMPHSY